VHRLYSKLEQIPVTFPPPLNFLFIAILLYIGNGNTLIPLVAIAVTGWLTVIVVYILAKEMFGSEKTALIAALICGLYPNFIFYGGSFYSETLALLWIVGSFLMLAKHIKSANSIYTFFSAILWALASQTRAGLHYFSLFIAALLIVDVFKKEQKIKLSSGVVFLGVFWVTFFSIGIAAKPISGENVFNSKNGVAAITLGVNRIMTPCTDYGHVKGNLFYDINHLSGERWPTSSQIDPREIVEMRTPPAAVKLITFALQDPLTYIGNSIIKLSCFWSPNQYIISYIKSQFPGGFITEALCFVLALIYIGIVLGGIWGLFISRDPLRSIFISFIIFYCILIFFSVGNSKLRLPLMPFFIIYCSFFLICLRDGSWRIAKSNKMLAILTVVFLINSIYKYREIRLSPPEIYVQKVELCTSLGFPKTAISLLDHINWYQYTLKQKERLEASKIKAQKMVINNLNQYHADKLVR